MELLKKNFYMEQRKAYTEDQISLKEDIPLGSESADINEIIAGKAMVKITDQKIDSGKILLRGSLIYEILYEGDSAGEIHLLKKELPFEKEMYIDSLETQDEVDVNWYLEDFSPQKINARKINIKALITIKITVEEMKDAKVAVGFDGKEEHIESQTTRFEAVQLKSHRKDVLRVKQDLTVSATSPNIHKILWEDINLRGMDWKAGDGRVVIHGEVSVFILYQAETQNGEIEVFETAVPISGNLDITGCQDKNYIDLEVSFMESHIDVKEDFDGEKRVLSVEMAIHVNLRCYEESQTEIVSDLYGITRDIKCQTEKIHFKKLLYAGQSKKKLSEQMPLEKRLFSSEPQILYHNASVAIEESVIENEDLKISGFLWVKLFLYHPNDKKYKVQEGQIPIEITVALNGLESAGSSGTNKQTYHITADVEQILVNMSDLENLEVRALINLHMIVLGDCEEEVLTSFEMEALDAKKIMDLPGMVVYFAKEGESLWQVGKKYYMSVSQIREQNHIVGDTLHQGDKLLLVKTL